MSREDNGPEDALTTSEQELHLLVETIPALVWRAGPEGNIEYVNKRVLEYLGAPLGEVIGWGWMDKVHPDDVAFRVRTWLQNLESGNPHDAVCRIRGADARYRLFEVRGEPLRANDGKVLSWYGVLIDIDDRRKAEEALRESEYKLRQIIDTVPGLLWSIGPDGELTQINQGVLDYSGMRFEDHLGYYRFHHPDDLSDALNAFSHAMQTGTFYQALSRLRRADGEYRWHQVRAQPLRDREGRIVQWYGLSVDIEERKQAEDRLRRSEAYLAEAQRLSHTGSFGWTPSTGELHWSAETFRILEYEPSIKPTIERVLQRIHPDDRAMIRQLIDETSRGEKDFDVTHRLLMPDGSVKFVHVLSHALKDAAGNLEIVGALMDVTENSRLYRDLAEREAKIQRLVDSNIIGIFIWEAEGRILEANDAFLHMVGYDRKDVVSGQLRWTDLAPAEWRERDERALAERKSTGKLQPYEKEYFRKDGSRVPALMGAANFEESGNQGVAFVLDLTERKRAEQALRESEYKLRQIIETVPGLLWSNGPDSEPTHVSQRMLDYSGVRFEDFKHRGWEAFVHPAEFPETAKAYDHAIQTGTSYEGVMRLRRADGEFRWHHARCEPLRDRQGRIIQWYGLSVDIDERKKAEDLLRRSEARLAEAQRLTHIGVAAYNETAILYGSEEIYRIWGFDPAEGVPSREAVFQRIHPDDRDRLGAEVHRALGEKRRYSIGYRIVLPNGTVKHLESIGEPEFSATGELIEIVATQIDVTERKRAEDEHEALRQLESDLAHMNRLSMMGELAASLAHEITQPIATARNNARAALNFLDREPADLGEVREALGCVVADADRAGLIVDRIRDHIKKAPPRKQRFDLNEAINEVIVLARSAIAENGVSVQTRLTEGLVPVEGDRVQLQQVILNLVLNAAEAMSAVDEGARELLINTEQSGANDVLVAVRDSGPGIDPDHLQRVFEAFYTTKSTGVGMGLAICRSIIEAHGGRLWADANEPRGAAFRFALPTEEGLTNSLWPAHQNGEQHGDTA
jgi:PAS domain S-box-containing protein